MGAGSRSRDCLAAGRSRGELPQYLQPRSRCDLRRGHPSRRQAVPAAAQRGQAARVQAGVGSVQDRAGNPSRYRGGVRRRGRLHPKTLGTALKRLGVIGSMVWDTIHGRDPAQAAVQEWGGISYALAALDATLPEDWEIVPLIKVGRDLAPKATEFLRTLRRTTHHARFLEVPEPNKRVTLRYESAERRCEQMSGGVSPWTWPELGPLVRDLDAVYVNFISGFEMNLDTAQLLRRGFPGFIYADLHSLFLAKEPDGTRVPSPLPQATTLCVTLGKRGAAYFTGNPIRTQLIPAPAMHQAPFDQIVDPTGCGDVFGGAVAAMLLAGASIEDALRTGNQLGARNVNHHGATGLRDHLMGRLSVV